MVVSVGEQMKIFAEMFAFGIIFGIVYDFLYAMRYIFGGEKKISALFDAFFWIFVSVSVFCLNYCISGADMRIYTFVSLGIGTILYFFTVSRFVKSIFKSILTFFSKIMGIIFKFLLTPLGFLYKIIMSLYSFAKKPAARISKPVTDSVKRIRKRLS